MSDHRVMPAILAFGTVSVMAFVLLSLYVAATTAGAFFNSWTFLALLLALLHLLCASLALGLLYPKWRQKPHGLLKMALLCVVASVLYALLTAFDPYFPAQVWHGLLSFATVATLSLWGVLFGGHGLLVLLAQRHRP